MRTTVTIIKADVGSVGGHTLPSPELLYIVRAHVGRAQGGLLIDSSRLQRLEKEFVIAEHEPMAHGLPAATA